MNTTTEALPKHDGENLKQALAHHGWTGRKLAAALGKGHRTVYDWFAKDTIKVNLLKEIAQVSGIPFDDLRPPASFTANDDGAPLTPSGISKHHGLNVKSILNERGIKLDKFARKMGYTRITMYSRLKTANWDEGELLKAAQLLQVPMAQLKGKGTGQRSFEKDIYEELKAINSKLTDLANQLAVAK